ncbi:hypothetical protein JAAARDRAFT_34474 [Jaapia argillacea MUCL 33604]|uniref:Uncharacterized protein n=1 Tax=Jaapia argillacea MUCL 33604 TaxID=933084 RepID=A0A067Q7R6_9AGAM|nr:hypothetical protein JAAARDRAFT_34474 [Jaapia argillacea MUCL 33604]
MNIYYCSRQILICPPLPSTALLFHDHLQPKWCLSLAYTTSVGLGVLGYLSLLPARPSPLQFHVQPLIPPGCLH